MQAARGDELSNYFLDWGRHAGTAGTPDSLGQLPRRAATSSGATASAELPQLVRKCVASPARSASDRCAKEAIAVPGRPLSNTSRRAPASPVTTSAPASGGNAGGMPVPPA